MEIFDAAIIGNGFCSLAITANLVRSGRRLSIAVIGDGPEWGPGTAYGRCAPYHLLNVPAKKMSLFADEPDDFLDWLIRNIPPLELKSYESEGRPLRDAFLPRCFYGRYLQELAGKTAREAAGQGIELSYKIAKATDVVFEKGIFSITSGRTPLASSRQLILATGVPPAVTSREDPDEFITDPWSVDFQRFRNHSTPVVILGTGLTMIDVVASLHREGFKGRIIALSRRGLIPKTHSERQSLESPDTAHPFQPPLEGPLVEKAHLFRENIYLAEKAGISWQAFIDSIRVHIPGLWQDLSLAEQKTFLRRLAPYWNIHRHRQPSQSARLIEQLQASGQLVLKKSKPQWKKKGGLSLQLGDETIHEISHVFNCRGPDYSLQGDQLLNRLAERDLVRKHPNGLGVEIADGFSVAGKAQGSLFVTGSLTTGAYLDSTSVPDLRHQCAKVAQMIS